MLTNRKCGCTHRLDSHGGASETAGCWASGWAISSGRGARVHDFFTVLFCFVWIERLGLHLATGSQPQCAPNTWWWPFDEEIMFLTPVRLFIKGCHWRGPSYSISAAGWKRCKSFPYCNSRVLVWREWHKYLRVLYFEEIIYSLECSANSVRCLLILC